eukprot:SAG31_NODE_3514_length_4171_cov_6.906925_1_plen_391_part_00
MAMIRAKLMSLLLPLLLLAARSAKADHAAQMEGEATVGMNKKATPAQGSSIKLEPVGALWETYAGDRGIASPTTFSWNDGFPTAEATKVQCGLFTKGSADGFSALVQLAPQAVEVRAFVGSCCPSSGLLNVSLLSASGALLAQRSQEVAGGSKLANGVGNAVLSVRWGASQPLLGGSDKPAAVRVRWTPLYGSHNIQLNALAVYDGTLLLSDRGSGADIPPASCHETLCTRIDTCVPANAKGVSNCTDVNLSDKRVIDWLHGGTIAPNPPPPAQSRCTMPRALQELGHLQISGPSSPDKAAGWLDDLREWKKVCLAELNLSGKIYKVPQLEWGKTAYFQPLMMPFDRYFYNETLGNYTVGRYLDSLIEQYSGIDSVLLWPTCAHERMIDS